MRGIQLYPLMAKQVSPDIVRQVVPHFLMDNAHMEGQIPGVAAIWTEQALESFFPWVYLTLNSASKWTRI